MPDKDGLTAALPVLPPVRRIFRAVVATVVPEAAGLSDEGWCDVEHMVETALRNRPEAMKRQLRLAMRGLQWMATLRHGKPFTRLAPPLRGPFLASLENHRLKIIRVGFWGLRTLALLGYYARPEAAQEIGYTADPRGWEARGIAASENRGAGPA